MSIPSSHSLAPLSPTALFLSALLSGLLSGPDETHTLVTLSFQTVHRSLTSIAHSNMPSNSYGHEWSHTVRFVDESCPISLLRDWTQDHRLADDKMAEKSLWSRESAIFADQRVINCKKWLQELFKYIKYIYINTNKLIYLLILIDLYIHF